MTSEDFECRAALIIAHTILSTVCAFVFIFSGNTFFLYLCIGFFMMAFYNFFRMM